MKKRTTRCLALLLAVVMVLSVMPVAMAEETTQTQTYTKVTKAPADWSGTYLIVSEGDKLIMDGSLDELDVEGNKVDVTITDSKITGDYAKYAFTVEPMTGGYAIKSASGKYISGKSGSNKLNSGSTQSLNTIELTSGKVIVTSDGTTLQYNNAAKNGTRFRYYKSQNQQPISLYKIETAAKQQVETPTANVADGAEIEVGTEIKFECKTEGATIYYKTAGTEYQAYTGPISASHNETYTVKATKAGMDDSDEATFTYTVRKEDGEDKLGKLTSADQLTDGSYVMIVSTGYAPLELSGKWLTVVQPTVAEDKVTKTEGAVWTLKVSGQSVTLTDKNGMAIAPSGGNSNGIQSDNYSWAWSFSAENQTFKFMGAGDDTVTLASNTSTDSTYGGFNKFKAYKNNTVASQQYPCEFTLYRVDPASADQPSGDLPKPGDKFVIYNQNAQAVLAAENDSKSIEKAAATVADGKATPANGAVVFTVEQNGEYLRFKSEAYGYLCSNGTGNNAF